MNIPNDTTLIAAIIGCVTGCVSLAITLYKTFFERGTISIQIDNEFFLFFQKQVQGYTTTLQAALPLIIVNKSAYPLTVYNVFLHIGDEKYAPATFPDEILELEYAPRAPFTEGLKFDMSDKFDTPLEISSFGAYKGVIFFPFFPNTNENLILATLEIATSRGKKKMHCEIKRWKYHS